MFCENCGKEISDKAIACAHCGTVVGGVQNKTGFDSDKIKKIAKLALGVALVLILLTLFGAFKPGAVKTAKKLMTKGYEKGYAKTIWEIEISPYDSNWEYDIEEKKVAIKKRQRDIGKLEDAGLKISVGSVKRTKNYKKKEVKKIANFLEEEHDYETEVYKLQDVQIVTAEVTQSMEGEEKTEPVEMAMIKVKGKWYLDDTLSQMGEDGIKEQILNADKETHNQEKDLTGETKNKTPETLEEIEELVAAYYNAELSESYDGNFVVFHGETSEKDEGYIIIVRFQSNNADIAMSRGANTLFTMVYVEKTTGKMYADDNFVCDLW